MAFHQPDFLDARVVPPDEIAALGLPLLAADESRDGLALVCDEAGILLERRSGRQRTRLTISFMSGALQYRARLHSARSEMLVRACAVPNDGTPWRIVDATAGLGRDAFLLAFCGAEVTLVERHPVLALMLAQALDELALGAKQQATSQDPGTAGAAVGDALLQRDAADDFHGRPAVAARLHLFEQDAVACLQALSGDERPDVVYCDPMFPPRSKSAAVSGEMQILHRLVGDTADAGELLAAALRCARRRVVVKRPLRAPALLAAGLENIHPSYALSGRTSRFDVYLIGTLPL